MIIEWSAFHLALFIFCRNDYWSVLHLALFIFCRDDYWSVLHLALFIFCRDDRYSGLPPGCYGELGTDHIQRNGHVVQQRDFFRGQPTKGHTSDHSRTLTSGQRLKCHTSQLSLDITSGQRFKFLSVTQVITHKLGLQARDWRLKDHSSHHSWTLTSG